MMYSLGCVLVVIAPCVSCMRAMSVFRLCILLIIAVLFWRVRISPTIIDTSVSLPCPDFKHRFVVSLRLHFILGSCLFALSLMFCNAVPLCSFVFLCFGAFQPCVFYNIFWILSFLRLCRVGVFYFLGVFVVQILCVLCCFLLCAFFLRFCDSLDVML